MLVDSISIVIATVMGSLTTAFIIEWYRDKSNKDRVIKALYAEICYNKDLAQSMLDGLVNTFTTRYNPLHTSSYEQAKQTGYLYRLPRKQYEGISLWYDLVNIIKIEQISPDSNREIYEDLIDTTNKLLKDYPEIEKVTPIIRWMDINIEVFKRKQNP